jgi:hypothetical protein
MSNNNVEPGDIALLFYPCHQENKGRVCKILAHYDPRDPGQGPWWLCEFSRPVVTDTGKKNVTLSTIPDWRLRLLTKYVAINTYVDPKDRHFWHPA